MFNFETSTLYAGLQVVLYGLSGVFFVLVLFYLLIKYMMAVAKKLPSKGDKE